MSKARTAVKIALAAAKRPNVLVDMPRWLRDRGSTTMELRQPWWPYAVTQAVGAILPPKARVFEYGGGGSTLWLHDRGAIVTAVEHDENWYRTLRASLPQDVELVFCPADESGDVASEVAPGRYFDRYVATVDSQPDASLDLIIVDGRARVACGLAAMPKVKPGGFLLLDDSDRTRYQPLTEALSGWVRSDYLGLKPGGGATYQTSLWSRPAG